jgi:hypothetical protein
MLLGKFHYMNQFCKILTATFLLCSFSAFCVHAQTAKDLFEHSKVEVSWLGIDFSHVKLIGEFAQFYSAGDKSVVQIKDIYFPGWNQLVLHESSKYDIRGMLRKDTIKYDIDMVMAINSRAPLEDLESYNNPNYTEKDILNFVSEYSFDQVHGIGVMLIAECLNKNYEEAYFHFVALNLPSKQLLIHERIRGEPGGFGLRNYWAGAIHDVMKSIKNKYYRIWKHDAK